MSFYSDASLTMIPSGYKDQKVYSVTPTDGSGDLTFSRASSATRVNSSGLVEKVRTNVIPYSQAFDNAIWIKDRNGTGVAPSVTANNATAPDGTLTADTIVFNAGAGTTSGDSSVIYQAITLTGSATASFYARVTSGTGQLVFRSVGGSTYATANLTTTWQRFSAAENGVSGFLEIGIRRGLTNEPINASVTVQMWGAQLETGDIATDYIATTTAAVSVGPVSGLPRLDYSGGATCPSLLLEPQRTNDLQFSEQADNGYWNKDAITISANTTATLDPSGYYGADKIQEDNTTADHSIGNSTVAVGGGETATFSVFLKAAERNWAALRLYTGTGSKFAYFNLSNGTLGTVDSGATATIVSYGNGWYRCSITITMASVSISLPYVYAALGDGSRYYAGTTGSGIYCWGFQHEKASYATSYIPTLSTAVTRVADAAYKTGISSLIGQTEGTIFLDFELKTPVNNDYVIGQIYNSSSAGDSIFIYITSANVIEAVVDNSGNQARIASASALTQGNHKLAIAYKANDFVYYIDGVQIGTDTSGTIPTCDSVKLIDYANGGGYMEKSAVNQYILFKTRLSNADLATLTTL